MNFTKIYPPNLYSVKYDGAAEDVYTLLFDRWNDITYLISFLTEHRSFLSNPFWRRELEPEDVARQILDEANDLEDVLEELYDNTTNGERPDFDAHFKYLEGKYKSVFRYVPMKSYGNGRPSFLRLYAIRLMPNVYVITGGGIKLAATIQDSPDLKDHVLQDIDKVRKYMQDYGIIDNEDL